MKEKELRARANCDLCGELLGASGIPVFWTAKLQSHGLKLDAMQRHDGLTALLGGNARLAQVMGADEEMTVTLNDVDVTICHRCSLGEALILHHLAERATERDEQKEKTG